LKILLDYYSKIRFDLPENERSDIFLPTYMLSLRLQIKKLVALHFMIGQCDKNFDRKKSLQPFRDIYKSAGVLREIHLEQTMLEKYATGIGLPALEFSMLERQAVAHAQYDTFMTKKNMKALNRHLKGLVPRLRSIRRKEVHNYLINEAKEIHHLLSQGPLNEDQIHLVRKKMKRFMFNRKSIKWENPAPCFSNDAILPKWMGIWHDHYTFMMRLNEGLGASEIYDIERKELTRIHAKIEVITKAILSQIQAILIENLGQDSLNNDPPGQLKSFHPIV